MPIDIVNVPRIIFRYLFVIMRYTCLYKSFFNPQEIYFNQRPCVDLIRLNPAVNCVLRAFKTL